MRISKESGVEISDTIFDRVRRIGEPHVDKTTANKHVSNMDHVKF